MIVRVCRWLYTERTVISDVVMDGDGASLGSPLHLYGLEDLADRPIPEGDYELHLTASPKVQAGKLWSPDPPFLPLILPTPGREGIRIHAGNTADDVEGCIALGTYFGVNRVLASRLALTQFMNHLRLDAAGLQKVHSLQIRRATKGA